MPNNEVLPLQTAEQLYVYDVKDVKNLLAHYLVSFTTKITEWIDISNSKVTLPFEDHWGEENCLLVVDSCLCATNLYFVM